MAFWQRFLRAPALGLALGSMGGVMLAEGWVAVGGVVLLLGLVQVSLWRLRVWWCLGVLLMGGLLFVRQEGALKEMRGMERLEGRVMERKGVVVRLDGRGRGVLALMGGRVRMDNLPDGLLPGDVVGLRGRMIRPREARNPGEVDHFERLRRRGVAMNFQGAVVRVEEEWERAYLLRRWAQRGRVWVSGVLSRGLEESPREAAILRGVLLGEKSGAMEMEPFRLSGTMHVFAVSGLHVGLVGLMTWGALWGLGVRRRSALIWVGVMMVGYAFLTGMRPPAMRAALMGSLLVMGFLNRRKTNLLNSLGVSVPIVLWVDSFQLFQMGFQLSYVVLLMIGLFGDVISRWLRPWVEADEFLPKVLISRWERRWIWLKDKTVSSLSVSAAAWCGSAPVMIWKFRLFTPIGVVATVCLMPLVFLMLGCCFLSIVVSLFWDSGSVLVNRLNGKVAGVSYGLVEFFESVPGGHWRTDFGSLAEDEMVVFAVEGGGACSYGAGGGVLIDGGSDDAYWDWLGGAFRELGVSPELVVVSHADGAHCGGLVPLLRRGQVERVMLPVERARSEVFLRLLDELVAEDKGEAKSFLGKTGMEFSLGNGCRLEVLRAQDAEDWTVADDHSLVVRYSQNGWRVLFVGDLGMEGELALVKGGGDLSAEVLVMGRHGYDYSGTSAFLRAVSPQVVIASEAYFPEGEEVSQFFKDYVRREGIQLYLQSESGGVSLTLGEEALEVRPFFERAGSERWEMRR